MNKIFSIIMMLIAAVAFTACSSDEGIGENNGNGHTQSIPAPKVSIGTSHSNGFGGTVSDAMTTLSAMVVSSESVPQINPKADPGYTKPTADGLYKVFFYIRIDGKIPGADASLYPASKYFPRTANGQNSTYAELNQGTVRSDVDWKKNSELTKYLFATDGKIIQNIIVDEPTIEDLIAANTGAGDDFSAILDNAENLHVIWYVCKKQNDGWHVDGILTTKDKTTVEETEWGDDIEKEYPGGKYEDDTTPDFKDGEVEVDIHQQGHNDWEAIKTSIHIRAGVDVTVNIPVKEEYLLQKDDFDIRVYDAYFVQLEDNSIKCVNKEDLKDIDFKKIFNIEVSITEDANGITIKTDGVTQELIDALKTYGEDGLTLEVWNYIKIEGEGSRTYSKEDGDIETWKEILKSTATTDAKTTLKGQITSAFESKYANYEPGVISYTKEDYDKEYYVKETEEN